MNITKNIVAIVMTACLILVAVFATGNTVFANSDESFDPSDITSTLETAKTPYFGAYATDFDVTGDDVVDVFDLGILKKKLAAGEPGITVATVKKLESWILNRPDSKLEIEYLPTIQLSTPSEKATRTIQNLTSNDFRFIEVEDFQFKDSNGEFKPAAYLYFLGVDEYVCESIRITNFCTNITELSECIVNTHTGIIIGIKDNEYTLVLSSNTAPTEVEETDIGPAYVVYDLTTFNPSNHEDIELANYLQEELTCTQYTFDITKNDEYVTLLCKSKKNTMEIHVPEYKSKFESKIYQDDEFYLFFSTENGFGIYF